METTMPLLDGAAVHGMDQRTWHRTDGIRRFARLRGFGLPTRDTGVSDAPAVPAIVNHGRWIAFCPDCIGAAELVWLADPRLFCMACGNRAIGGLWRTVEMPADAAEITASLSERPRHEQGWEPDLPPLDDEPDDEEEA
jgi:hypothetical protein